MSLRTLGELLSTDGGAAELEACGVHSSPDTFAAALEMPERRDLHAHLGADGPLVYVGQQLSLDYAPSVVAKFRKLRALDAAGDAAPVLLGLDTDRVRSERNLSVLRWPPDRSFRLVPRSLGDREIRFAPVTDERIGAALSALRGWLAEVKGGEASLERLEGLEARLQARPASTLADANAAVTEHLLSAHLAFRPPLVRASDLLEGGFFDGPLTAVVEAFDGFVSVYNAAIDRLVAAGIDPVVRRREPDELPLYYSCPVDDRRLRLRHDRDGACRLAVAECRCGNAYRFELGRGEVSLGEITATGRWSTDVTLPMYMNGLTSGVVAGRKSALYGLVLNEVVRDVLGGTPVPLLVPPDATSSSESSLLVDYLAGT